MIERLTADTQARLAYLIVGGHFVLKFCQVFGITVGGTDELAMLAAAYFFMRQRPDVPRPGDTTVITSPQTVTTITPPQESKPNA